MQNTPPTTPQNQNFQHFYQRQNENVHVSSQSQQQGQGQVTSINQGHQENYGQPPVYQPTAPQMPGTSTGPQEFYNHQDSYSQISQQQDVYQTNQVNSQNSQYVPQTMENYDIPLQAYEENSGGRSTFSLAHFNRSVKASEVVPVDATTTQGQDELLRQQQAEKREKAGQMLIHNYANLSDHQDYWKVRYKFNLPLFHSCHP